MEASALSLRRLILGYRISQALAVAAKLGIADALADGPRNVHDLARRTGADPGALYRVLRLLAGEGVFAESTGQIFELTPLAQPLRQDAAGSLRARAIFDGAAACWSPWGNLLHSVMTGEPSFERTFGMSIFEHLRSDPDVAAAFDAVMSEQSGPEAQAVAAAYEFAGRPSIVDVGGGQGVLLSTILQAHPEARGVLFDQPRVVAGAAPRLQGAGVVERCETVGGSFFEAVPEGGDAYLLKHVLQDWDDARCITILRNCGRAMSTDARLLVIEALVAPGNTPDYGRFLDVNMLVLSGGRERTEEEYRGLFDAAGLQLSRVVPTPSHLHLIEGMLAR